MGGTIVVNWDVWYLGPRTAKDTRRKALVVENRLVTLLALAGMTLGFLAVASRLAETLTALGAQLSP